MILRCPVAGWSSSLEEAPDPVFAGRMLGDGILIDPTGNELFAPCDGEIISIAAAKHAIAIRGDNGVEILMHVGIDTVNLAGAGFEVHVTQGARVSTGAKLLTFDLDFLARNAKSLLTPIIITNSEQFALMDLHLDRELAVGDALVEIRATGSASAHSEKTEQSWRETVRIEHEHGVHARPAALIATVAKRSASRVEISARGQSANAASAVALMSLGIRAQDEVVIHAFGPNAQETVAAIKNVILSLEADKEPAVVPVTSSELPPSLDAGRLRGVVASRGLVVGRAFRLRRAEIAIAEQGNGIAHERSELERARTVVRTRLQELAASAQQEARQVIEAHLEFVDDPELVAAATSFIEDGKSAAWGWRRAIRNYADAFKSLGDARMAERVDDLADVEHQVIAALTGDESASQIQIPDQAIVIAADLQPSQFVALDRARLAGVCLAAGGPTSHVAILAAAAGIPLLVALGKRVQDITDGSWLVLDADQGILHLAPTADELTKNSERVAARREQMEVQRIAAQRDCYTSDAVRIEVFANLGSLGDAKLAMTQGAEGCGLLRTEFLFLDRERAPDEGEQLECYQEIADALAGRPLVVRTLDIGGDKPIPYLPLPAEANPALGLRGVRTSLWRPDLLRTQLRAILSIEPQGQCRILLPMITDIEELRTICRLIEEVRAEMEVARPSIGVMIETPASAVLADQLAREVDFLSIGTNDLTQYTLAMDRGHADLATRLDGLHPGVLRLIAMTCDAASKHQRLVAVCGGLASDPVAAPVLVGLGVGELSVVPAMIPQIKQLIASITLNECRALAQTVLQLESAEEVRSALRAAHRQSEGVPAATAKWG